MRWGGNDLDKYGKKLQKQVAFDETTCFCCFALTKKMQHFLLSARKGMFAGETLAGFPLLFNSPAG